MQKKPTKQKEAEIIPIKAKPIKTPLGQIIASGVDKLTTGEKINSGCIVMGTDAGSATVDGVKITILQDMGASITLLANGRYFHLDPEALINHAIEHGFLNPDLVFEKL